MKKRGQVVREGEVIEVDEIGRAAREEEYRSRGGENKGERGRGGIRKTANDERE